MIARERLLHPALVTIVSGGARRLGRIRPELWGSYDALALLVTNHRMSVLSAKARAAFPDEPDVLVLVTRDDTPRR